jgi:hypothetical protein
MEYLKDRINSLATNSMNKNVIYEHKGINEFKKGCQPRNNLVKDETGDLLAYSHNILNRWKNYFPQLLNMHMSVMLGIQKYIQLNDKCLVPVILRLKSLLQS